MNERPDRRGAEPRQRWRLIVRRGVDARDMTHRDVETAWAEGLERADVPVVLTGAGRARPRLVFGAPVPVGMTAEHEPLDLFLVRRLTIAELRPPLLAALPPGHELVDLYDVWSGSPSIAGLVLAGDYRCEVAAYAETLAPAVHALLESPSVMRQGRKGDRAKPYDLRPLVDRLALAEAGTTGRDDRVVAPTQAPDAIEGVAADARSVLTMRLRIGSETVSGRPDEVIDVLAGILGRPIVVRGIVRERLVLAVED